MAYICSFVPLEPGVSGDVLEPHPASWTAPPKEDEQMLDHIGVLDRLTGGGGGDHTRGATGFRSARGRLEAGANPSG